MAVETGDSGAPDPASADGEAWARTVLDSVAERESDPSGSGSGPAGEGADQADGPDGSAGDTGAADTPSGDAPTAAEPETADPDPGGGPVPVEDISIEDLVADLERVSTERDHFLDTSRRIQAEFENYKKQVAKRETEARERANDSLIGELLPVLDAFDGALATGADDVAPMRVTFPRRPGQAGPGADRPGRRPLRSQPPRGRCCTKTMTGPTARSWPRSCGPATSGRGACSVRRWSRPAVDTENAKG